MAEEKKNEEEEVVQEKKKSGSMMLIIIIVVLIVVILVGAIVAILMMGGEAKSGEAAAEPQAVEKEHKPEESKEKSAKGEESRTLDKIGTLFPLEEFTVNLLSENGSHYLKTKISLELSEPKMAEELEAKKAVIRDKILRTLSSKSLEEVSTLKGKEKLGDEMKQELNGMLKDGEINGVYFTDFVIQ